MRLVCPNCGAQYAIDPRIIPEQGRDVQCSACAHTWFQGRDPVPEAELEPDLVPPSPPPPAPDKGASVRRDVDPEVMAVLKAEAERERRARAAELAALEVQPDLDLPQPETAPSSAEPKAAQTEASVPPNLSAEEDPALRPAPRPRANTTRGDLLPDIEEINSTLEPAAQQGEDRARQRPEPPSVRIARIRRGQGRRYGFALACFIFGLAALLYARGPQIGQAVPAFAPMLDAYVQRVQDGRLWLDSVMRRAGSPGTSAANING